MSEARYGEWMARARNHQYARRPLDAMQCFRVALREWPRGVEARFHLGEALWQLGRLDEALDAWRDIARTDPSFLPALQALAEAALGTGDPASARAAAARVLGMQPRNARALAAGAIAAYAASDGEAGRALAVTELVAALAHEPAWLAVPALGGSVALALDRFPDDEVRAAVAIAASGAGPIASLHPRLHALLCEHEAQAGAAEGPACAAMLERPLGLGDHDAVRRAARAAARAGYASAAPLATLYGRLCIAAAGSGLPLLWPRRTAGTRPRVVIVSAAGDGNARALALANQLADAADVTVAEVGLPVPAEAHHGVQGVDTVVLSPAPGVDDARRLAAFDADVLVDLAGLDAPVGLLLAHRPARRLVSAAGHAALLHPPLVDAALTDDAALVALAANAAAQPSASADRATLDAAWRDAVAAHKAGDADRAARRYAEVLEWQPAAAPALYLQAMLARESGDTVAARAGFAAALREAPGYDEARIAALAAAGAVRDADDVLSLTTPVRTAAAPPLLRACGLAWLAVGQSARAEAFFAAALEQAPSDAATHYNAGVALQGQRRFQDAARCYQRALACDPALVAADFNLGVIFTELGNGDGAIAAFRAVLAAQPRHVAAHRNLCEALLAAGRIDEWLGAFRRFEAACPDALPLAVQALEACHYAADFAGLERYLEGLRQERFVTSGPVELVDALEQLLYLLLYFDVEPQIVRRFAETYDRTATQVYGPPLPRRAARAPGRVRIGYLSADLRNHVMGKMMFQALRHHDRAQFDVRLYSLSGVRDEWTTRFEQVADAFVPLDAMDDPGAIARIAADDLDILVDLNTHTRGARPALLAAKPSRVQVTHVASAGTLGLRAVDFKLTDRFADVPESQDDQIEPLLPMDGCIYPWRHIEPAASHGYTRAALGLPADAFVIGAFVNPLKLSRRCLTLWRETLARIPRALIAFSPLDPALREVYRRVTKAGGIDAGRIVFVPAGRDESENQARYAVVDVVLDPMPFGGVNGTMEALDAGVPVVTLLGKRHGERTSYSILANLGVVSTVAGTGRDYVELAVRLADDPAFAVDVRQQIARGLQGSPLTDMKAHARNLEAAYREALARRAPEVLADIAQAGAVR